MMKKFVIILVIVIVVVVGFIGGRKLIKDNKAWEVEIINQYINIRDNHMANAYKKSEVKKGEKYKVTEMFLEDKNYVWYKIVIGHGGSGWIASKRDEAYVKEYNNPNFPGINSSEIEYKKPIIEFKEPIFTTNNLKTINYEHLKITEDSEYKITHEVYFEEFPVDQEESQYWIKYIVKDKFNNISSKVQKIEFKKEPSRTEVLKFEDMK